MYVVPGTHLLSLLNMCVVNSAYLCGGWFTQLTALFCSGGKGLLAVYFCFISMTACYYGRKDKQNMMLAIDILKQIDC